MEDPLLAPPLAAQIEEHFYQPLLEEVEESPWKPNPCWLYFKSLLWLFVTGCIADKAATYAAHRNDAAINQCNNTQLPDLVLDLAPDWSDLHIPDYFLYAYFPSLLIYACNGARGGHSVIYRTAGLYGILLLMRSLTIISTSYPAPGQHCRGGVAAEIPWRWWGNSFFLWYRTCGDYMFSGHTMTLVLVSCVHTRHLSDFRLFRHERLALGMVILIIWAGALTGMAFLLLCRYHYLCDVVVGAYITVTSFCMFNFLRAVVPDGPVVRFLLGEPGHADRSNCHKNGQEESRQENPAPDEVRQEEAGPGQDQVQGRRSSMKSSRSSGNSNSSDARKNRVSFAVAEGAKPSPHRHEFNEHMKKNAALGYGYFQTANP